MRGAALQTHSAPVQKITIIPYKWCPRLYNAGRRGNHPLYTKSELKANDCLTGSRAAEVEFGQKLLQVLPTISNKQQRLLVL